MGHTVLVVPVPELEPFVRERTEHYDASYLSEDPAFVHAHITLLAPFHRSPGPADLAQVGAIAAQARAFDFVLDQIEVFPDGTIHLPPDPSAPFAELTERLTRAFPECVPYEGRFPVLVPHLTLDRVAPGIDAESVRRALGDVLPATCRADVIALHRYANHDCRVLTDWKLG